MNRISTLVAAVIVGLMPKLVISEECDAVCEAARNAQDPLADVRAIITDNTLTYGDARRDTVHNYQVQPVYSMNLDNGNNLILRGVIPYLGVPSASGHNYGLSDTIVQAFYVPKTDGGIKYGFGPQISLPTRENATFAGPGWGWGGAAVAFGFAGSLSYGGILAHHFGESNFSTTSLQPIVLYNTQFLGGSYFGYNTSITYDWNTDQLTLPLGLTFGKTFVTKSGLAIDVSAGFYNLIERPAGTGEWQGKWGISFFFP